ncbi:aldehyde dehydrogenase family protein, partial [Streptomyces sp. NPDC127074]|uniref:aldehyde dehydrogenase family protein n=1 Tax=Streptomyces sp. NPDC127074 TaxID=3347130 RepID=UPI00365EC415
MSYFSELALQFIDGEWRGGSGSWDIVDFNPYNGEKLASITVATVEEVDLAYRAAERAQPEWGGTNPYTRRAVFERALRIIEDREKELTETIIAECGGTHVKAGFEFHLAKEFLREAVHLARGARGAPRGGGGAGAGKLPRGGGVARRPPARAAPGPPAGRRHPLQGQL